MWRLLSRLEVDGAVDTFPYPHKRQPRPSDVPIFSDGHFRDDELPCTAPENSQFYWMKTTTKKSLWSQTGAKINKIRFKFSAEAASVNSGYNTLVRWCTVHWREFPFLKNNKKKKNTIKDAASSLRHSRQKQLKKKTKTNKNAWRQTADGGWSWVSTATPSGVRAIGESQRKSFLWGQPALQGPPHCGERR